MEVYGQDPFCHVFSQWWGICRLAKCYWVEESDWPDIPGNSDVGALGSLALTSLGPLVQLSRKQKQIWKLLVRFPWFRNICIGSWDLRRVLAWRTCSRTAWLQGSGRGCGPIWGHATLQLHPRSFQGQEFSREVLKQLHTLHFTGMHSSVSNSRAPFIFLNFYSGV